MKTISMFLILISLFLNSHAQMVMETDSTLNNLVHPEWYKPIKLGELGKYITYGKGKIQIAVISGFGQDNNSFLEFMMSNSELFTFHFFLQAGYGGTIAPPLPANPEQDYGKRTWSLAFENAVVKKLKTLGITNLPVMGIFNQGVQHATHLAHDHPDVFSKLILVGGVLYQDMMRELTPQERRDGFNSFAKGWFKVVTQRTWYSNQLKSFSFAKDSIRGRRLEDIQNLATIPTFIQYLGEFMADDIRPLLKDIDMPILKLNPSFDKDYPKHLIGEPVDVEYYRKNFINQWNDFSKDVPNLEILEINNTRLLIIPDEPEKVKSEILKFIDV